MKSKIELLNYTPDYQEFYRSFTNDKEQSNFGFGEVDMGSWLPSVEDNECEIVRINLASTTSDKISIRAKVLDLAKIEISILDEYMSDYNESDIINFCTVFDNIPTQGELFNFLVSIKFGETNEQFFPPPIVNVLDLTESQAFFQFESSLYPDLDQLLFDYLRDRKA